MKKTYKKIRRVGIIANVEKLVSRDLVRKAVKLIAASGRKFSADTATAELAGLACPAYPDASVLTQNVDLILVFGGDGTMLRVARELDGSQTPLLGINMGALGFLTDVTSSDLPQALRQVWNGDFTVQSRALLEAKGACRHRVIHTAALNDVVVSRGIVSRLIELEVTIDGELLTRYRCDGLIVSSPTGSTAYSLAAGGAIVAPTAEVFTITPICPHTLSNRSVIVSLSSIIRVTVLSEKPETILSADGQNATQLTAGDTVTVQRSEHSVRFVHLTGTSFFKTLRHKLQWSGTNIMGR